MNGFPVAPAVAFVIGCAVLVLIKRQFPRISVTEFVVILALYAVLVILFTDPIVKAIKGFVG